MYRKNADTPHVRQVEFLLIPRSVGEGVREDWSGPVARIYVPQRMAGSGSPVNEFRGLNLFGEPEELVEVMFVAGLTENRPADRLRWHLYDNGGSVLLCLVPESIVKELWSEVTI